MCGRLGVALGLGAYTFAYARGWAYMTDDPRACANCHVMNEQYDGWIKSSHRSVAVCNDCHVPHASSRKYATKARNGFWHSYYFTTGTFPEPIRALPASRAIAEANCRRCHDPSSRRWARRPTPDSPTSRVSGATGRSATWNFLRPTSHDPSR